MKEKFKKHFELPKDGFLEPIDLKDTKIGFSVYKERSTEGFKSLFRVFITDEQLENQDPLKSIVITASYGKESSEGLILSSNEIVKKSNWPIEFISEGEFFYNIDNDKLYFKDKEISGIDLLNKADSWHIKPTQRFKGSWLRFKIFWFHQILAGSLNLVFKVTSALQYLVSGEKITIFHDITDRNRYMTPKNKEILDIKEGQLIDLWGYKVKPWIAAIYCTIHLVVYLIFYYYHYYPMWLVNIFKNNFLTLSYGIISLGLANTFLPIIFKPIQFRSFLKYIQLVYLNFAFRKVRI